MHTETSLTKDNEALYLDEILERLQKMATLLPKREVTDEKEDYSQEAKFRALIIDLRVEIMERDLHQKKLLLETQGALQKLRMEMRDLRYAILLGASRKDRKRCRIFLNRLLG